MMEMEENQPSELLGEDDVISANPSTQRLMSHNTFTVGEFTQRIKGCFESASGHSQAWVAEGIPCRVLKPNSKGWRTGKVRVNVNVEFIADGPEPSPPAAEAATPPEENSPLDSIRQTLNPESPQ